MHHFHLSHSDYYRDRRSVSELCYDFPGDEILVRGLDAMQMHFANNRSNIEIPVLRVMNAAHYLAAYMLETTCSGDQTEYDTLAYASVGRDKQLTFLTMVVLAAMLKRTEGFRARNCRNLILENRSEDFDEGVTLYERFLQSSEKHFAEEDFLIDIPSVAAQLREKDELIAQQTQQITTLENTITTMEEKYQQINIGTQYKQENNHGTIYNGPVTINQYAAPQEKPQQVEDITPAEDSSFASDNLSDISDSIIFTKKAKQEGKIPTIVQALQKSIIGRKDKTRALGQELQSWQNDGYVDAHYNARVMYDELEKLMSLPFGEEVFRKHYNNTRA